MEGNYPVYLGSQQVGQVSVKREGLYCRFQCRCSLEGDVCRLYVQWEGGEAPLGILIPQGDGFCLDTRLPAKRLGGGKLSFSVRPGKAVLAGSFIPLAPEEPFAYIERLKQAHLERRGDVLGIVIPQDFS